ncbi:MAG: DUF502 domain-containing protein [bacterium]|nr:DUF502 domain-containing protein [bacterium]
MTSRLKQYFLAGLLTIAPAGVTGWILWRVYLLVDRALRPGLERFPYLRDHLPPFLITLMGVAGSLIVVVLIGLVMRTLIGVAMFGAVDRLVARIPVIKSVFGAVKQVSEVLLADNRQAFQQVVAFEYPRRGLYSLGFVTQDEPGRPLLHVFLPTTPNPTSGFLLLIPRDEVTALPLTVEEGIRLIISGGAVIDPGRGRTVDEILAVVAAAGPRGEGGAAP